VRLTRLCMRQDDSDVIEDLSVAEAGSSRTSSAEDVIDVQYEVTSEQQKQKQPRQSSSGRH